MKHIFLDLTEVERILKQDFAKVEINGIEVHGTRFTGKTAGLLDSGDRLYKLSDFPMYEMELNPNPQTIEEVKHEL